MTTPTQRLECLQHTYRRLRDTLPQDTHTQEHLYDVYLDLCDQVLHPHAARHAGERYQALYDAFRREVGR